jgi:PAS domain S-box-containing protein
MASGNFSISARRTPSFQRELKSPGPGRPFIADIVSGSDNVHTAISDMKLDNNDSKLQLPRYQSSNSQNLEADFEAALNTDASEASSEYFDGHNQASSTRDGSDPADTVEHDTSSSHATTEPVLHVNQMEFFSTDTTKPVALPPNISLTRGQAPSMASMSDKGITAIRTDGRTPGSSLPEFFSQSVFQTALQNPTIAHQLLLFSKRRLCAENLEFIGRVNKYQVAIEEVSNTIYEMHKDFIASSAPAQLNLTKGLLLQINNEMKTALATVLPDLESLFADAQSEIERLVYNDVYPNFVRHQMSVSAARALGGNRGKYGGLGDCFVLTDPAKADNPIVYASDGFVTVTGHPRNEIIPRNCRFLQSRDTDQAAVGRIRDAVKNRHEHVELLLNTRKTGEPFWNLLYTAPLYDVQGRLAFFIGGQVNCSTTIHSASDVLRILSQPTEPEPEMQISGTSTPTQSGSKLSRARSMLNALKGGTKANGPAMTPGMEGGLVRTFEDKSLTDQLRAFYTAYSNASIFQILTHGTTY